MPDLGFVLTSFGPHNAAKKCLLLHGLMGTGAVFFKVAERLVKDGYVSLLARSFTRSFTHMWPVLTSRGSTVLIS